MAWFPWAVPVPCHPVCQTKQTKDLTKERTGSPAKLALGTPTIGAVHRKGSKSQGVIWGQSEMRSVSIWSLEAADDQGVKDAKDKAEGLPSHSSASKQPLFETVSCRSNCCTPSRHA